MNSKILTEQEVLEQTAIASDRLHQLLQRKLIKPWGTADNDVPIFAQDVVELIKEIEQFFRMGYSLEEIEKIAKKVGFPSAKKSNGQLQKIRYLTVGELASRLALNPRTIKYWEERGIIEPDTRSEGGFRLYAEQWVYLCNLIKDLQLFGYSLEEIKESSDLFRDFLSIRNSIQAFPYEETRAKLKKMKEKIASLYDKMNLFKEGIQRWEELLKKKEKEIRQFRNKLKAFKPASPNEE